jgi:hypothetical protein
MVWQQQPQDSPLAQGRYSHEPEDETAERDVKQSAE